MSELWCPECKKLIGTYARPLYGTAGGDGRTERVLVETLLFCKSCGFEGMVSQRLTASDMCEFCSAPVRRDRELCGNIVCPHHAAAVNTAPHAGADK